MICIDGLDTTGDIMKYMLAKYIPFMKNEEGYRVQVYNPKKVTTENFMFPNFVFKDCYLVPLIGFDTLPENSVCYALIEPCKNDIDDAKVIALYQNYHLANRDMHEIFDNDDPEENNVLIDIAEYEIVSAYVNKLEDY